MRALSLTLCAVFIAGCVAQPNVETAADLADAIEDAGYAIDSRTAIDFSGMQHARIDEGYTLRGDGLLVEVLRISDARTFDLMTSASALLTAIGAKTESEALTPPDIVQRRPFVVVIRQEPEQGGIRQTVERVVPEPAY
jgi:hypothetical protein